MEQIQLANQKYVNNCIYLRIGIPVHNTGGDTYAYVRTYVSHKNVSQNQINLLLDQT